MPKTGRKKSRRKPTPTDFPEMDFHHSEEASQIVYQLGLIILDWNICEHFFSTLAWHYLGDTQRGVTVTTNLGNHTRADLLLKLAKQYEPSKEVIERIQFANRAFHRMLEIRNVLVHTHTLEPHLSGKIEWRRPSSNAPLGSVGSLADHKDLTVIHTHIGRLATFIMDIVVYHAARENGRPLPPLPEPYPLLDKLVQLPPEDIPLADATTTTPKS